MSLIPPASFLAGSLISLLIPIGLLIALVVWHLLSIRRIPAGRAAPPEPPVSGVEPPGASPSSGKPAEET